MTGWRGELPGSPSRNGLPAGQPYRYGYRGQPVTLDPAERQLLRLLGQAPGGMTAAELGRGMLPPRTAAAARHAAARLIRHQLAGDAAGTLVITAGGRRALARLG